MLSNKAKNNRNIERSKWGWTNERTNEKITMNASRQWADDIFAFQRVYLWGCCFTVIVVTFVSISANFRSAPLFFGNKWQNKRQTINKWSIIIIEINFVVFITSGHSNESQLNRPAFSEIKIRQSSFASIRMCVSFTFCHVNF